MNAQSPIRVLANARDLVDLLAEHGELTPTVIAERLEMPRASVYRLVDGLESIGLTEAGPESGVRLSPRWLHLADAARDGMREWASAHSVMERVAGETGLTVFLCVPRADGALCIDWVPGRGIGILVLKPGRLLPLNAGAAGRVVLAYGGVGTDALDASRFTGLTSTTLVTRSQLEEDVARTRRQGHVLSLDDATVGVGAVGVPILRGSAVLAGALSVAGVASEVAAREAELAGIAKWAAQEIASSA